MGQPSGRHKQQCRIQRLRCDEGRRIYVFAELDFSDELVKEIQKFWIALVQEQTLAAGGPRFFASQVD
jgi:hypothetical protein